MNPLLNKREERRKKLQTKAAGRWYDIKNKAGDIAEVRIYDEIGWFGTTAEEFVAELDEVTAPEILVAINCPGGDVFDGIAIYNALRAHRATVTTRVDALAASIASVIAQAGDRRVMLSSSQMMIHDAWGLAIGNAKEMRQMAELLDRQSDVIAGIYAARGTNDVAHYRDLMENDSWFTDEEAVAEGLADEVIDPSDAEAKASLTAPIKNQIPVVIEETHEEEGRTATLPAGEPSLEAAPQARSRESIDLMIELEEAEAVF